VLCRTSGFNPVPKRTAQRRSLAFGVPGCASAHAALGASAET
jgi:hypothetical protein